MIPDFYFRVLAGWSAGLPYVGNLVMPFLIGLVWPGLLQIQTPPIEGVGNWLWNAIGALAIVVLILTAIVQFRKAFGRTPPIDTVLAGLATLKHVDEANERVSDLQQEMHLRSRGLEEQISALRHELRDELQASGSQSELREQRLNDKLEQHWKELNRERSASTKHLHERIEAHTEALRKEIDAKVEKVSAQVGNMPQQIITMLRDTGVIRAGGVR